jgi:hypothetical protein
MTTRGWPPPPEFWSTEFSSSTGGGRQPALFKGVLPQTPDVEAEVARAIAHARDRMSAGAPSAARLRVYIGEERRDDLATAILARPLPDEASLCSGVQRLAGAQRFCIVINNFELLSPPLATMLGRFLGSMFEVRGMPVGGAEQVAFAGNYSGTAFGVHEGYEHAFLAHFGPGPKDFYCWSQEDYVRLTGSREPTYGGYDWLLPHAQKFVLEPGDVLYLPALVYHIGKQDSFSVSVAMPLYTFPKARYVFKAVIPELLEKLFVDDREGISPHVPLEPGRSPLRESFHAELNLLRDALRPEAGGPLAAILDRRWFALVSNGGWEVTGEPAPRERPPEVGSSVRLRAPFRVCWDHASDGEDIVAYLRGQAVRLRRRDAVVSLLHRINTGEMLRVEESNMLEDLRALAETGGLEVIQAGGP